ncbi:ATP-binding protein [Myxococcus fulvus]|uniref:ATP-binding protein n=1 Tax=Myxococcus fulvus TaxID=33 RepID=UPI003B9B5328
MAIRVIDLSVDEVTRLLSQQEGHFVDMKSRDIKPAKLTKSLSAFANADGGELFVGVEEPSGSAGGAFKWLGFDRIEDANGLLQSFDALFPLGQGLHVSFLAHPGLAGFVLHVQIEKTRDVKRSSDGTAYVRRSSRSQPVDTPIALQTLERAKGVSSFEDATVNGTGDVIANSVVIIGFSLEVVPHAEPLPWLKKQQLIVDAKPTVAGCVLFADEPQVFLPKAAVKIYRYKTTDQVGTRDTLVFDPITIEGHAYAQIRDSVDKTVEITEKIQMMTEEGLRFIRYPRESLHEIITNAVLHRDYAFNDDVHVRIFDNRIEVESPGRLPAHITPKNILAERFARNPKIVRLINKFPNPPNKDVGEGLNTAFEAMKKLRLRDPEIVERDNSVLVYIRHETLASPAQLIIEHVKQKGMISNSIARGITGIQSEVKVRHILKRLVQAGEIEQVPGTFKSTTAYRIPEHK